MDRLSLDIYQEIKPLHLNKTFDIIKSVRAIVYS